MAAICPVGGHNIKIGELMSLCSRAEEPIFRWVPAEMSRLFPAEVAGGQGEADDRPYQQCDRVVDVQPMTVSQHGP